MALDFFNTYYMAGMISEIIPQQSFFRDRYFPTNSAADMFSTDKVLIEYMDGDRRMAPFVAPRVRDIPIMREGYKVNEYAPPRIAPSRVLTIDDLKKRGFGEAIYSQTTEAERARALQMRDLTDLDMRIRRREEWMAAQTMINNGCTMIEYFDNGVQGDTVDVFFYDTSASNPALYTVANEWDATGGDFWGDVEEMCVKLAERGLDAADLVVGSDVAQFILDDEKAKNRLDNRRMEFGSIAPSIKYPGVAVLGTLNFGGFLLEIYAVRETYVDDSGTTQRYFPAKSAMVTAPGCGHLMYSKVTQMDDNGEFETIVAPRVPKLIIDQAHEFRALRLTSRPLAAPRVKAPWIYAANVVE